MTKDVQHDRSASPLASVSDEIHPKTREPMPDPSTGEAGIPAQDLAQDPVHDLDCTDAASGASERDSFEGFGSFG